MHATLAELLENMKSGLLWVNRDGMVRYANSDAGARTALAPGRKLYDPDLMRAVSEAVSAGVPRAVVSAGAALKPGTPIPELNCRVIPGLARDDAFVLIGADDCTDHGTAYDNLMLVIRSDLRDPLRSARDALSTARDGDSPAVESLVNGVEDLVQVLDKLIDLASVWGGASLLSNDRIELWPMLQKVWAEIEPLAMDRNVKVRFCAQSETANLATMFGSEHWLRRVFLECLEAAVRSSRRGATLNIEHRQLGPRALIVLRDCSAFAARDHNAVEMKAATTKDGPTAPRLQARELIGLKLCRHIVALHGGELREETEDGLRNFLIDLPTGAPAREDNTLLDVAQAQQYAKDLAELMSRARKPKPH